ARALMIAATMAETLSFSHELFSPAGRANPYPIYARMRREQPLYRFLSPNSNAPVWIATRYDDCVSLLRDTRLFKDDARLTPAQREQFAAQIGTETSVNRHLLRMDAPDHARVRGLVQKAFSSQMVDALRPRIAEIIDELLAGVERAGGMDLIADFAVPLPVTVIAEMLGIPRDDRPRFRHWSQILVATPNTPEGIGHKYAALGEFAAYLQALVATRRGDPQTDLVSGLLAAREPQDDRPEGTPEGTIDERELLSTLFLLLIAGHETTVNLIGNGMLALLTHPEQRRRLLEEPSLMPPAIEEMLRFDGPVDLTTVRWSAAEIEIRDTRIPPGEIVLMSLLAADRDPEQFPDPDTFDVVRAPNRHIAFGFGSHYCLGAHLARMEGAMAISALLERLPDLALATAVDTLSWTGGVVVHGLTAMPVQLSPRAR
ncbi:MAG TPA: cytochrome P450, partial [Haliangium sp.]|nr:cytochrome P450 [Haliangium sp.]